MELYFYDQLKDLQTRQSELEKCRMSHLFCDCIREIIGKCHICEEYESKLIANDKDIEETYKSQNNCNLAFFRILN